MERSYKAGEVVSKKAMKSEYFYMLEEGKVDLYVGKQEEMRFLVHYPGEIFGWSALVKPHRYLASGAVRGREHHYQGTQERYRYHIERLPVGRPTDLQGTWRGWYFLPNGLI